MNAVARLLESKAAIMPRDADGDGLVYEGTLRERPATSRAAVQFYEAFESAFGAGNPYTNHVTHRTPDEIARLTPIMAKGGRAGVLVEDHGDGRIEATALFNVSGESGVGLELLQQAIDEYGVNYVECYGPVLNRLYEKLGFKADTQDPFAEEYAAPGWDYEAFNHPDYFTMRLREEKAMLALNDIRRDVLASDDPRAANQLTAALVLIGELPPDTPLPGVPADEAKDFNPADHPRDPRGRFSIAGAVLALVDTAESGRGTPADKLYGKGMGALFPEGSAPIRTVPWPQMARRRDVKDYDPEIVRQALLDPPRLQLIDPRSLRATQPNITQGGVDFYMNDDAYRHLGKTFENGDKLGNKYPFIYIREDGQALTLAGHHRATAALLKGEPLEAIIVHGPWGPPRFPA